MNVVEQWVSWAGAVMACVSLIALLVGVARGLRRPRGQGACGPDESGSVLLDAPPGCVRMSL